MADRACTLLEHELLDLARFYVQGVKRKIKNSKYRQLRRDWQLYTSESTDEQDLLRDCHRSQTWDFFADLSGGLIDRHDYLIWSPLQHVSFEPYRRLGFAIWDTARLSRYGFLPPDDRFGHWWNDCYAVWRSILSEDERAEVERVNERWESTSGSRTGK